MPCSYWQLLQWLITRVSGSDLLYGLISISPDLRNLGMVLWRMAKVYIQGHKKPLCGWMWCHCHHSKALSGNGDPHCPLWQRHRFFQTFCFNLAWNCTEWAVPRWVLENYLPLLLLLGRGLGYEDPHCAWVISLWLSLCSEWNISSVMKHTCGFSNVFVHRLLLMGSPNHINTRFAPSNILTPPAHQYSFRTATYLWPTSHILSPHPRTRMMLSQYTKLTRVSCDTALTLL